MEKGSREVQREGGENEYDGDDGFMSSKIINPSLSLTQSISLSLSISCYLGITHSSITFAQSLSHNLYYILQNSSRIIFLSINFYISRWLSLKLSSFFF